MEFDNVDNTDDTDLDKRVAWHHSLKRRMKLNVNRIETLDDVKLILDLQDLRIDTTHDKWCKLHLENKNKDHYWYEKHSEEDGIN